jgi:hypothetical protein
MISDKVFRAVSPERQIRHMGLLADNVRRYTHGLPQMNVVDKARGY